LEEMRDNPDETNTSTGRPWTGLDLAHFPLRSHWQDHIPSEIEHIFNGLGGSSVEITTGKMVIIERVPGT